MTSRPNKRCGERTANLPFLIVNSSASSSVRAESGGSSSGSSSGSSDSSTESSFSLHLSSGSDGGSDLSLLTSDVVLERLEKVEKVLVVARSTAVSVLFASYSKFGNRKVADTEFRLSTSELFNPRSSSFVVFSGPVLCTSLADLVDRESLTVGHQEAYKKHTKIRQKVVAN